MAGDYGKIHNVNSVPAFFKKTREVNNIGKYVVVFFTNSQTTSETTSMTTSAADACRLVSPDLLDMLSDKAQIISHNNDCRLMSPIFNELSQKYENLIFFEVDFFKLPDLMNLGTLCQVKEVPSFAFFKPKGSEFIAPLTVGADKEELERRCVHYDTTA